MLSGWNRDSMLKRGPNLSVVPLVRKSKIAAPFYVWTMKSKPS